MSETMRFQCDSRPDKELQDMSNEWGQTMAQLRDANATIAGLMAEVAGLRARPAMAWRRREEGEELEHGSHLAMVRGSVKIHAIDYRGGQYVTNGRTFEDVRKVTHYIPWSDLMPPGGEDAS